MLNKIYIDIERFRRNLKQSVREAVDKQKQKCINKEYDPDYGMVKGNGLDGAIPCQKGGKEKQLTLFSMKGGEIYGSIPTKDIKQKVEKVISQNKQIKVCE